MLDFHSHLIPGVDDGAVDLDESRKGLETFRAHGVNTIVTTPHLRGSMTMRKAELDTFLDVVDDAWEKLTAMARSDFPELRLERGVELMLDVPSPVLDDERVTLGRSRFVLVEFPFMSIPAHSKLVLREIAGSGRTPIIAHPERYSNMNVNYGLIDAWRDTGARIQVNCGSLLGHYGAGPKKLALTILREGLADYLSSDYHSRGKCAVAPCAAYLKSRGGEATHHLLTHTNPLRILEGKDPLPVPPFEPAVSMWERIVPW